MTTRTAQLSAVALLTVCSSLAAATAFADCELLSVADAEFVLGPNVTDLSGDDAATQCMFIGGAPQAESGEPDYLDKLVTVGQRLAARLE
jgi:hypothetical protein